MRIFLVYSLCFLTTSLWGQLTPIPDFGSNPGNLNMHLYVPSSVNKYRPVPLVIALHGCSQNAEELAEQSGWNILADRYGFIVLYPEQKRTNNVSRCFNWFRPEDIRFNGESASILQMIRYAQEQYTIQDSSIYTYGLSAGAAMSVSLLAEYPQTFAAGASLAGGPYGMADSAVDGFRLMSNPGTANTEELKQAVCQLHETPRQYPRLIVLHGRADKIVDFRNSLHLVQQWAALHATDAEADSSELLPAKVNILKQHFLDSGNRTIITLYLIDRLGHNLPVDPGTGKQQGGSTGPFATDIDFFSTYAIAQDFGLIPRTEPSILHKSATNSSDN